MSRPEPLPRDTSRFRKLHPDAPAVLRESPSGTLAAISTLELEGVRDSFVFPTVAIGTVWHIGSMDPARKGANAGSHSLEGACLSVSLCPHAWQEIARLGGNPLHELAREGARFVDMVALAESPLADRLVERAVAEGLVRMKDLWKAWTYDDEHEEWRYRLCRTRREALEEAAGMLDDPSDAEGPDGGPAVEKVTVPVASRRLMEAVGMELSAAEDATDAVLLAYAMRESGADGAWWDERYDPECLSAPRGGIFPHALEGWTASVADWDEVEDVEHHEDLEEALRARAGPSAP